MGLDQFIERVRPQPAFRGEGQVTEPSATEGVAYFRKVNFLHKWVEDHLNEGRETNCEAIPFHLEAMAGLMATCAQVLDKPELGPELLPTMGRFFFGSEDYDEYYLGDVRDVLDALTRILAYERVRDEPGSGQYVYSSSW